MSRIRRDIGVCLLVISGFSIFTLCAFSEGMPEVKRDMRIIFDEKYENWKQFMDSPQSAFLSDTTGTSTPYFEEIINLGIPALPYIFDKMEEEPILWVAVRKITKRWFTKEERKKVKNNIATLYLNWWKEGRKQTPQHFEKLYSNWKDLKKQAKVEEAEQIYGRIIDLGIVVLPYMVKKIEQGDSELIPAVSELTDGAIDKNAMISECVSWWEGNKNKWIIPE